MGMGNVPESYIHRERERERVRERERESPDQKCDRDFPCPNSESFDIVERIGVSQERLSDCAASLTDLQRSPSRKHTYIILTSLNPILIQ